MGFITWPHVKDTDQGVHKDLMNSCTQKKVSFDKDEQEVL